jgi:hypothetical protein
VCVYYFRREADKWEVKWSEVKWFSFLVKRTRN